MTEMLIFKGILEEMIDLIPKAKQNFGITEILYTVSPTDAKW